MGLTATVQAAIDLAFEKADDLVAEVWLTRQRQTGYDAATGDATVLEVEFKFEAIVDKADKRGIFDSDTGSAGSEVDGSQIEVVMKPGDTIPKVGDVLRVGEERHRVLSVDAVKPDGSTVLLWQLMVAI